MFCSVLHLHVSFYEAKNDNFTFICHFSFQFINSVVGNLMCGFQELGEFVKLKLISVLLAHLVLGQSHEIDQDLTTSFAPTPVAVNGSFSLFVPLTLCFDPVGSAVKPNTYWISHKLLTTFPRP